MSTASVRAAIVRLVKSIPAIGLVHDYERFSNTEKGFLDLYGFDGGVRGWRVSRVSSRRCMLASGRVMVTTRWAVVGLLSLVDGARSEIAAGELADALIAAERADPTLGGVLRGRPVDGSVGFQLLAIEPVVFAGVLCHRVSLQLDGQTFESGPTGWPEQGEAGVPDLAGAVATRLAAVVPAGLLRAVHARTAWDRDDDPAGMPAAIVTLADDTTKAEPETFWLRQRVERSVAVIIVAPAEDDLIAAGGFELLRSGVRTALHGWGDAAGIVDVPLLFAGGAPIEAAPGLVAWRDVFKPSIYLESCS